MGSQLALPAGVLFTQPLTPVAHSLLLSFLAAAVPIAVALVMLGVFRRPAWQASSLPASTLGAMVGRQLPFFAFLLPFYVVGIYGGVRSIAKLWPALVVSGGSFALAQFVTSNYLGYQLTDVLASLTSLIVTITFLKVWTPEPDPAFAVMRTAERAKGGTRVGYGGWLPWIVVSVVVIVWVHAQIAAIGDIKVQWPSLHNAVYVTLYNKPYAAVWDFQPMGTGTAILLAAVITSLWTRTGVGDFFGCALKTWRQTRVAIATVMMIVGLGYLLNYSGMSYTLGITDHASATLRAVPYPFGAHFTSTAAWILPASVTPFCVMS